jgi:hypothetical protein
VETKHLEAANEFITIVERRRSPDFTAGDAIIALSTALGFMIHYRNDDTSLEEVMGHVTQLIRMQAEHADRVLAEKDDDGSEVKH